MTDINDIMQAGGAPAVRALVEGKAKRLVRPRPKKERPAPKVQGLLLGDTGQPLAVLENAILVLDAAHPLAETVALDTFSARVMLRRETEGLRGPFPRALHDGDELEVTAWLQREHLPRVTVLCVSQAIRAIAGRRAYDALEEYVRAATWDGVPRVDTFAEVYLRAEPGLWARAVSRVLLLSLAARALRPGCKVDTVPILEGAQGAKKSTALEILGGLVPGGGAAPFYAELQGAVGSKAAAEEVEGAWVVELAELDALSRAEATAIKAFLSRRADRFRRAYARNVSESPRRCVCAGTTNPSSNGYLRDETGARRFLPLLVGEVDTEALYRDRAQVIAEAVARVEAGEAWHLSRSEELEAASAATVDRREVDPWEEILDGYLNTHDEITTGDLLVHLGLEKSRWERKDQMRIGKIMHIRGFRRERKRADEGLSWVYRRRNVPTVPTLTGQVGTHASARNGSLVPTVPTVPTFPLNTCARARTYEFVETGGNVGTVGTNEQNQEVANVPTSGEVGTDELRWLDGADAFMEGA